MGMALVQTLGVLIVGPLDRLFNTRKWVVVVSAVLALAALTGLAFGPTSLAATIFLLFLLSGSAAYGGILYAHVRSLFPEHLAGPGLLAARLPVHLCRAGALPGCGTCRLPHRQGLQAASGSAPGCRMRNFCPSSRQAPLRMWPAPRERNIVPPLEPPR